MPTRRRPGDERRQRRLARARDGAPGEAPSRDGLKAASGIADASRVELVVLAIKEQSARCRPVASDKVITLRAAGLWDVVPGEIVTVQVRKAVRSGRTQSLWGEIDETRLDVPALGLTPLRLAPMGTWNPAEEYWGEDGDPVEAWARVIIARGPRPEFEMEQVLPGDDPDDPNTDPIIESNDRKELGDLAGARRLLMALLEVDLRCLDAHAHLGNLWFDGSPAAALRHYEIGVRIGELSLSDAFMPVLRWACIDNRPFLRCLNGYGLCLWRLGRWGEAARVFERIMWLNPSDNQGIRFVLPAVRARRRWERLEDSDQR